MTDLAGRRVLVVGASSGIGREVASMAAERGARVAAAARRRDRLSQLDVVPIVADVRVEDDCRRLVHEASDALGGLDGLVYCVGTSMLRSLELATMDDWRTVFESNVFGAALVAAEAAPELIRTNGRALFLSSKATRDPFPHLSIYTTSKVALDGLLTCLSKEFPGLRVGRVVVGNTIGTEFSEGWEPDDLQAAFAQWEQAGVVTDMGLMHPAQVAAAVLFALSSPGFVDDIAVIDTSSDDGSPPARR